MKIFRKTVTLCFWLLPLFGPAQSTQPQQKAVYSEDQLTDEALIKALPGFANGYVQVNGTRLHYVAGGTGEPLVLLPGWPETWWCYRKIMPLLAAKYRVIVVEFRGMGSAGKPAGGYDKKTMAKDVYELMHQLGHQKVYIAGHDIGAQVAFSFAANYPAATSKLVMMEVQHPDESYLTMPMLPPVGTFTKKESETAPYLWWYAFNQVQGLPEELLAGRAHLLLDWIFKYELYDESAIGPFDRAVYNATYNKPDGLRAGNAWYQAFVQDVKDYQTYKKLEMPVLGIGGLGFKVLGPSLAGKTTNLKMVKAEGSGHYLAEEKPKEVADFMLAFLKTK